MQILKGSDQRREDFNEYVYSKGSIYEHHDIDKATRLRLACRETANSNDYSEAEQALLDYRKEWVNTVLTSYPPHFARASEYADLVDQEEDRIRWNTEALVILSNDLDKARIFRWKMDYAIVDYSGINPVHRHHSTPEFKAILSKALGEFKALINPAG